MRMRTFIKDNREELDQAIKSVCSNCQLNDAERENWILNDEGLYDWARREGVLV